MNNYCNRSTWLLPAGLIIDNPSVDLSSSEIRSHKFNSIDNLIPPYIIDYIKQHRIY